MGDAGAVEVAVERHEREALCLGRKGHDVCLPTVARAGPSISQCDSQKRKVDLPALLDEGEAGLEHPSDSIARGVLEGERHGTPRAASSASRCFAMVFVVWLSRGVGASGTPKTVHRSREYNPLTIRAGCQSTSPENRAMTG